MESNGIDWVHNPVTLSNRLHVDKAKGQFAKLHQILLDFAQSDTICMHKIQNQPFIEKNSCLIFNLVHVQPYWSCNSPEENKLNSKSMPQSENPNNNKKNRG